MKNFMLLSVTILANLFLYGCTSYDSDSFNYQGVHRLKIGEITKEEITQIIGPHRNTSIIEDQNGRFEIITYRSVTGHLLPNMTQHALKIELKDGYLNAYSYATMNPKKSADFDYEAAKSIKLGDSENDVLQRIGTPSGKCNCPTYHSVFENNCDRGVKLLLWFFLGEESGEMVSKSIIVALDENGLVTNIDHKKIYR